MTNINIIAVKIHEDSRNYIPAYLKYSQPPTTEEYAEFLEKGENGKGGLGFHECMNFKVCSDGIVRFYLPPGYFPAKEKRQKPIVIIWVSYSPHRILGIQYGCNLCSDYDKSWLRDDSNLIFCGSPLVYHGYTEEPHSILFTEPLEIQSGKHLPQFQRWQNGLRYCEEIHLRNIVVDRYNELNNRHDRNAYENDEFSKLLDLAQLLSIQEVAQNENYTRSPHPNHVAKIPDKILGDYGEQLVYEDQLSRAAKSNVDKKCVEWTSRRDPQSVYDIRSFKVVGNNVEDLFIEVKTTQTMEKPSIFISARQIEFAEEHKNDHTFAFVDASTKEIRYLTVDEVKNEFSLQVEKYRLERK